METVLRNINNVLVYINDVLLHTATHKQHLQVLEKDFERLHQNHLKVNLDKCVFGNREVSYLGFMLTPEGIRLGINKLQAIWDAQPTTNIKMVRLFVGLCNFFLDTHQRFCNHCGSAFQSNTKRLWIQKWSTSSRCTSRIQGAATATHIGSGNGFSKVWQTICPYHRRSYRNSQIFWRAGSNINTNWSKMATTMPFLSLPDNLKITRKIIHLSC